MPIGLKVVDAKKAVIMLSSGTQRTGDVMKEVQANIQERAKLALSIIIGNNQMNKKHGATSSKVTVTVTSGDSEGSSAGGFRSAIHDVFMAKFAKSMLDECGIKVNK